MGPISFLRESLRDIKTVGTVTRSSKYLCKGTLKPVNFETARYLVELGAGDGVITEYILAAMHPDAKLLSFEINPKFCKKLRELKDERLILVEDTAEKLPEYLKKNDFGEVDSVISAIPFVSLPKKLADNIVGLCRDAMRVGAPYSQVHYSLIRKKVYEEVFGNVKIDFVPMNIPPAFVLTSHKH